MRTLDDQTARQIAAAGDRIYLDRVSAEEKAKHEGEFVAIDPDSGRYAFGRTLGEAATALSRGGQVPVPRLRLVGQTLRVMHA